MRFARASVAGAAALALLGGASPSFKTEVQHLDVQGDTCGGYQIRVDASGHGQRLRLFIDGDSVAEWDVHGTKQFEISGDTTPGRTLEVTARIGKKRAERAHVVLAPFEARLAIRSGDLRIPEGHEPRFEMKLTTPCDPTLVTWEATVRQGGTLRSGRFLPTGDAWFVIPAVPPGTYDLDIEFFGPGVRVPKQALSFEILAP